METKTQIPIDYTPYDEIILCSNRLINVKKIIDDKGFVPLFIGENKRTNRPQIWLNAKSNEGVIKLIEKNRILISLVELNDYSNDNQIDIILDDHGEKHILIQIENLDNIPSITKFDLRKLGYNIYGDEKSLHIGSNVMSNSSFQVGTLIGI